MGAWGVVSYGEWEGGGVLRKLMGRKSGMSDGSTLANGGWCVKRCMMVKRSNNNNNNNNNNNSNNNNKNNNKG